jgi:hypothetical protein
LLVFEFGVKEVKVVFGFYVVEHVVPVDVGFSQDRVDTHFVVVKFAGIGYKILEDDGGRLKVDGKSFGGKIARNWFSDFLFWPLVAARSFPHFLPRFVRLIENYLLY